MRRRFGKAALAHPGRFGFEMEDVLYVIGPFAWLGLLEYFLVAFSLGPFGYLLWLGRRYL